MNHFRQWLSDAKTRFYRQPKDELLRLRRWGADAYFNLEKWQGQMEVAAWELPELDALPSDENEPLEIWFLTGKRFWYQTAFCAWTLARHSQRSVVLNVVDDGTLTPKHEEGLRRLFPDGVTLRRESVRERIEDLLPESRFPMLRKRWVDYINIRKLTDVHLGSSGRKLVLDSDMLFFDKPKALLNWFGGRGFDGEGEAARFCLMKDCEESYGYSRSLMKELCGTELGSLLNVGVCGFSSEEINWEELEAWCQALHDREGTSYYLEQALVAMLASRAGNAVLPRDRYVTFPSREQTLGGEGVLQHYVSDSKPWYFKIAWKLALEK